MARLAKRLAMLAVAGTLTATSLTGCGTINTDETVATVGDEKITLGVANFYARLQQAQYETYYASMMGTTAEEMWAKEASGDQTYEEQTKKSILENLENMYLVSQHVSDYDVALTEEEQQAIKDAAAKFSEDNSDDVKKVVSGDEEEVAKVLELMTISNKMEAAMEAGVDENVSDEDAAQKSMQYLLFSYTAKDDSGESKTLSDDEKEALKTTAQAFDDRLKGGEDMETVASAAGLTAQTATFDSESTSPDKDLIAAADALTNAGDVTDIIETENGIYIAKLTSLLDRGATDSKKESIVSERKQEQYDSLLKQWKKDTKIKEEKKVWKKISFEEQGVTSFCPCYIYTSNETKSVLSRKIKCIPVFRNNALRYQHSFQHQARKCQESCDNHSHLPRSCRCVHNNKQHALHPYAPPFLLRHHDQDFLFS